MMRFFHRWLGLAAGIILWIEALTGALLAIPAHFYDSIFGTSGNAIIGFFRAGHISLWISHTVGAKVLGYAMLAFIVIIFTGIALWDNFGTWIPRSWKTKRAKLFNLHAIVGMWALPLVVIFCLAGACCCLPWLKSLLGHDISAFLWRVHTGHFWGAAGRVIVGIGAFITATLPLTGFLIWRKGGRR